MPSSTERESAAAKGCSEFLPGIPTWLLCWPVVPVGGALSCWVRRDRVRRAAWMVGSPG